MEIIFIHQGEEQARYDIPENTKKVVFKEFESLTYNTPQIQEMEFYENKKLKAYDIDFNRTFDYYGT